MVEEEWVDIKTLTKERWLNPEMDIDAISFTSCNQTTLSSATPYCNFCKIDIWNRYIHCSSCNSESNENSYDICVRCFALGRGCKHRADVSSMILLERYSITSLIQIYVSAVEAWNNSPVLIKLKNFSKIDNKWING
jgi:hypothetical protein